MQTYEPRRGSVVANHHQAVSNANAELPSVSKQEQNYPSALRRTVPMLTEHLYGDLPQPTITDAHIYGCGILQAALGFAFACMELTTISRRRRRLE